jgi:hypothetical protein
MAVVDPEKIYSLICPDRDDPKSYPSSGPIGTAFGKWLGLMYMREMRPQTYGMVDFSIYMFRGSWTPNRMTVFDLKRIDPGVALALTNSEWSTRGLQRTDILDRDLSNVYEIKPIREQQAGPPQLAGYLQALNTTATTPPALFASVLTPSTWTGGTWDPSRYPLVVPGAAGQVCVLHAWRDPTTQGLILYDIVCCTEPDQPDAQVLVATHLAFFEDALKPIRPRFVEWMTDSLPMAPPGSTYAYLVTPRVYETFIKGRWESQADHILDKLYGGPQLSPALQAAALETFVLGHIFAGSVSDQLFVMSNLMEAREVHRLWETEVKIQLAVGLVAFAMSAPEAVAASAQSELLAAEFEPLAADLAAGDALAAEEPLVVGSTSPTVRPPLVNGSGVSVQVGRDTTPGVVNSFQVGSATGKGVGIGLGVVGAIVVALAPADATAGTPPGPGLVGADPVLLAPVELLVPSRGRIYLREKVTVGGDEYFIAGLVTAG